MRKDQNNWVHFAKVEKTAIVTDNILQIYECLLKIYIYIYIFYSDAVD